MFGIRPRIWLVVAILLAGTWRALVAEAPAERAPVGGLPVAVQADPLAQVASPARVGAEVMRPASVSGAAAPATPSLETGLAPQSPAPTGATAAARPGPPVDTQLVILEDEAAREALRRGLAASGPSGAAGRARDGGPAEREPLAHSPDEARRTLSDALLVDHLSAEVYRTTVFSRDQDGVGETRDAALQLIRSLTPQDRRELLASALADSDRNARPVFEESPRMATIDVP